MPPGGVRALSKTQTSTSAADGINVPGYTQLMGDLHEMILGDAIALGDLLDRREPIVFERQIHQHA